MTASASGMRGGSRPRRRGRRATATILVGVALAALWLQFAAPTGLGGPVGLVWVSGTSMEPGLHTGDLGVVYRRGSYDVGDVVAFEIPGGGVVIHRISDRTTDGYQFQGDNRRFRDPWVLGDDAVIGELVFAVPRAAMALTYLGNPLALSGLVSLLVLLWFARRAQTIDAPITTGRPRSAEDTVRPTLGGDPDAWVDEQIHASPHAAEARNVDSRAWIETQLRASLAPVTEIDAQISTWMETELDALGWLHAELTNADGSGGAQTPASKLMQFAGR